MIIHWRSRRSRTESANRGVFFWSRVALGSGGVVVIAPPVTGGTAKHIIQAKKPKRQKYTFPNGITVWATSEALARLLAGQIEQPEEAAPEPTIRVPARAKGPAASSEEQTPEPAERVAPEVETANADGEADARIAALRETEHRRRLDALMAAAARDELAVAEAKRLALRAAEEERIILRVLMMDEAA